MMLIAGRRIESDQPPYIIAEISANHLGKIDNALSLIELAKEAGADAVKLQTYTADTLTIDHNGAEFLIEGGLWDGRTLYDLYEEAHTPWDWHEALFAKGREVGVTIFSSPFDSSAVDYLEELGCPAYKIASFEAIDLLLIQKAAATGKPLIISTGMSNLDEIEDAVKAARTAGCEQLALLHCLSAYPTPISEANLLTMTDMARRFDVVVGFSDHTKTKIIPPLAVVLGGRIIEKHFIKSRDEGGPDAAFSAEPDELKALVNDCKDAWLAGGTVNYALSESEQENTIFRRSIYVVEDIAEGALFNEHNIRSIRPGLGLPPKYYPELIGKHASKSIPRGTPMSFDFVKEN